MNFIPRPSRLLAATLAVGGLFSAASLSAQEAISSDGAIAVVTFKFTLTQNIGGYLVTDTARAKAGAAATYPTTPTYATFYGYEEAEGVNIENPFDWDSVAKSSNYYVEKVSSKTTRGKTVTTVTGSQNIFTTRYATVDLFTDLATSGRLTGTPITSASAIAAAIKGYRLVAVAPRESYYTYFFAERGDTDENPIYVGSDGYDSGNQQIISFLDYNDRVGTKSWVETYTRPQIPLSDDSYLQYTFNSGSGAGNRWVGLEIRRPSATGVYYRLYAWGLLADSGKYNAKNNLYLSGPASAADLVGMGSTGGYYESGEYLNSADETLLTGSMSATAEVYAKEGALDKYLNQLPVISSGIDLISSGIEEVSPTPSTGTVIINDSPGIEVVES